MATHRHGILEIDGREALVRRVQKSRQRGCDSQHLVAVDSITMNIIISTTKMKSTDEDSEWRRRRIDVEPLAMTRCLANEQKAWRMCGVVFGD